MIYIFNIIGPEMQSNIIWVEILRFSLLYYCYLVFYIYFFVINKFLVIIGLKIIQKNIFYNQSFGKRIQWKDRHWNLYQKNSKVLTVSWNWKILILCFDYKTCAWKKSSGLFRSKFQCWTSHSNLIHGQVREGIITN